MAPKKHIASRFEKIAETYCDSVAIDFQGKTKLTYADLQRQAESLACRLAPKVQHGQLVPVMIPRCPEQIVAILAIAKLGAAYVPLDIDGPPQRLAAILESVQPAVVIGFPAQISSLGVGYKSLSSIICDPTEVTHIKPQKMVRRPRNRDDIGAVLFTSGSTGEPKGVILSHRNLIDPVDFIIRCEKLSDQSRLFQFSSCSFDVHLTDILCSVFSGSCLCQVSRNDMLSDLAGWIHRMEASVIHLTPSVISTLTPSQIPNVKYMITTGEPVNASMLKTWGDAVVLRNFYGPCEAGWSTSMIMTSRTDPTLIGSTPFYSDVLVLDDQLRPVSPGITGEIYCRGSHVAYGYWARPQLTDERFSNLPDVRLGSVHRGKWHKTGDLGTMLENGFFQVGARVDDQIKIGGGQRIQLGEIEHILAPSAPRVLVVGWKDKHGQAKPVAIVSESTRFCTTSESCTLSDHRCSLGMEVLKYGRAKLAQHMPRVVMASAIPMTLGGKVDKTRINSLLADYFGMETGSPEVDEKGGGCISSITRFLADQLQAPGIPTDEPLTDWGLTSLDAIRLLGEIYRTFSVSLNIEEIFRLGTIRSIASLVESQSAGRGESASENAGNRDLSADKPSTRVSIGQESIIMAEYRSRNPAFNCSFIKDIAFDKLEPQKLFEAVRIVCSQHEALRTTFYVPVADGTDSEIIHRRVHNIEDIMPAEVLIDVSTEGSRESAKSEALRIANAQVEVLFDLEKDSPVRTLLYQLEPTGSHWILQFIIHHAAIDEWSFSLFCADVEKIYTQLVDGTETSNAPSSSSYSSFVDWEQSQLDDETLRSSSDWWAGRTTGDHVAHFSGFLSPQTYALKTKPAQKSEFFYKSLSLASIQAFHQNFSQHKTPFVSWLALTQLVLHRMSGRTQFLLGLPVSKRGARAGFDDIIGFFLSNMIFPVDIESDDTFNGLTLRTSETYAGCTSHALPFGEILGAISDSSNRAQVDIMFVYHDRSHSKSFGFSPRKGGLIINDAPAVPPTVSGAQHDLVIHIDVHSDDPQIFFEFRSGSCERYMIESLSYAFEAALENLLAGGADQPLAKLPITKTGNHPSNSFTAAPLSSKIENALAKPETISILHLLNGAFSKYPNSVAIRTTAGQSVTYSALREMVEAKRVQFQKLGLGPGKTAALYLEKSLELVTTQLAVMMLGAATFYLDAAPNAVLNKTKVETVKPQFLFHDTHRAEKALELLEGSNSSTQVVDVSRSSELETVVQPEVAKLRPSDTAFIWFTSGSTGQPKCFTIPHYALASSIMANSEIYRLSPGHTHSLLCNTTFDPTMLDLFLPLVAGATLGIASTDECLTDMTKTINDLSITHITATPSLIGMVESHEAVPSLRFILLGGEPFSSSLMSTWSSNVELWNAYGPGETMVDVHAHRVSARGTPVPGTSYSAEERCIGKPFPTIRSYILDTASNLVLPGCRGQLHIGDRVEGVLGHLSSGYISPASANSKFVQHPEYGRLYNTGDICFYDGVGDVHFVGRADDQVKFNGIRLCLGDIDSELRRCTPPNIHPITLLCDTQGSAAKSLVAFFGLGQDPAYPADDGREAAVLPLDNQLIANLSKIQDLMISKVPLAILPRFWIPVNRIPQSRNGKIDRKLLQSLFLKEESQQKLHLYAAFKESTTFDDSQPMTTLALPKPATNSSIDPITETWGKVLSIPLAEIVPTTSFFKAGGDSILAIKFCSELRSRGVTGCSVMTMYKNPTLKTLLGSLSKTQRLDENATDTTSHAIVVKQPQGYGIYDNLDPTAIKASLSQQSISEAAIEQVYKANAMQASMVLQSMTNAEIYTIQQIWHLAGKLDFPLFKRCFDEVVQAEPALRTTFDAIYTENSMEIVAIEYCKGAQSVDVQHKVLPVQGDASFELALSKDRKRGFQTGQPMLRVSVFSDTKEFHHCIVVTMHHALIDGWSAERLIDQVTCAYNGIPLKEGRSMAGLPMLQSGSTGSKTFWKEELKSFPKDMSTGSSQATTPQASHIRRVISQTLWKNLESACRRLEITPVTLFQGSLAVVLCQLHDCDQVAFSVSRSGRESVPEGFENSIGMLLDVMPFQIRLDKQKPVGLWLQEINASFLQCLSYADLSLDEIVQQAPSRRLDLGAMLSFTNPNMSAARQLGNMLDFTDYEARGLSTYPLTMMVFPAPSGINMNFKFDAARIPQQTAAKLFEQAIMLLGMFANIANNSTLLSDFLESVPQQAVDLAASQLLHDRFASPASSLLNDIALTSLQFPDKVAVVGVDKQLTYYELEEQSTLLAQHISKRLIGGTRQIVPIMYEPSAAMVVAVMAILKSGNAYCPLDINWPAQRLKQTLQQVDGNLVLTGDTGFEKIQGLSGAALNVLNTSTLALEKGGNFQFSGFGADAPAYCIFTSGSTGLPKGCVISHSAVRNAVRETSKVFQLTSESRVMLCASYTFDASVLDIFASLVAGATLFCPRRADILEDLPKLIGEFQPTFLHLTPTMISTIPAESLAPVHTLVSGGEKLTPSAVARLPAHLQILDGYGPTEAAVQVSVSNVNKSAEATSSLTPLPGNILLLINSHGVVAKPDEEGELHIGGSQLMTSYLHDSEKTKQSMKSFHWLPHLPLYATGDFGKYTNDMAIRLLGRKDDQLKVSGQRVEVAEIESVLNSCSGVLQSCVVARGEGLHAFIKLHPSSAKDNLEDIRDSCRAHLPPTWVPSLSIVDEIPTTTSHKIDRRKMAELVSISRAAPSSTLSSKADETYTWLDAVLRNLLGSAEVQPEASLFDQGLNSIGLIRLKGMITQRYRHDISISTLRSLGSLEKIYDSLRGTRLAAAESASTVHPQTASTVHPQTGSATDFPALDSQVTMWVAQERFRDQSYNVDRIIQFKDFDTPRFFKAVSDVARGLDIFKTTFRWDHQVGQLKQRVHPESKAKVELHRKYKEMTMGEASDLILKEHMNLELDLSDGPTAEFHVYELSENVCCLYYNWHHILTDNFTSSVVLERIFDHYLEKRVSRAFDGTTFLALELQKSNQAAVTESSLLKWQNALTGFQSVNFTSKLGPRSQAFLAHSSTSRQAGTTEAIELPARVLGSLQDIVNASQTSLFTVLLAAWHILLHEKCSQNDITTTTPVSMRGAYPKSGSVLGNLVNTVLIRTQLLEKDKFANFLERTRHFLEFSLDNCLVPLDRVLRNAGHGLSGHNASFTMIEEDRSHREIDMIDHTLELLPQKTTRFDLHLWAMTINGDMKIFMEYDSTKFDSATMNGLTGSFVNLLGRLRLDLSLETGELKHLDGTVAEAKSPFKRLGSSESISGSTTAPTSLRAWSDDGSTNSRLSDQSGQRPVTGLKDILDQRGNISVIEETPDDRIMKAVRDACASSLQNEELKDDEDLFLIGLDSFLSMGLISMIRRQIGECSLTLYDIVNNPSISALSQFIRGQFAESSPARADKESSEESSDDGIMKIVRDACASSLQNEELNDDEDLFLVGLDSFLSMGLISMIRRQIGECSLTLYDIVNNPSISTLSQFIRGQVAESGPRPPSVATADAEATTLRCENSSIPANPTEERFFKLQEIFDDSTYNIGAVYNIKGHSIDRIMSVVKHITQKNAIFRSTYSREDGMVKRVIHPKIPASTFSVQDFSAFPSEGAHQMAKDSISNSMMTAYTLEEPSLFRCKAIKVSSDHNVLFLGMHHIIGDERSLSLLASEICQLCQDYHNSFTEADNLLGGVEILPMPTEESQPTQQYLNSLTCLQGHEPVLTNQNRSVGQTLGTYSHSFVVSHSLFGRSLRATPFSVLFFCFQILWRTRFGRSEDSILIPVSTRQNKDEMNIYGCFINSIPASSKLDWSTSIASNLRHSLLKLQEALENRAVSFETLLEQSGLKKDIFEAMFVFHDEHRQESGTILTPDADLMPKETNSQRPKFPLTLSVTRKIGDGQHELLINVDYDSGIVSDRTARYLAHGYEQTCIALQNGDSSRPLHSLDTLSNLERSDLREFGNLGKSHLAHQAIQTMVERAPNATCVIFEGSQSVTYRQFWDRVKHISKQISKFYSGSDSKIAILQDASIDRIATIIACVRAGFAYVPLDLHNPEQRTLAILDDCKPSAVLVSDTGSGEYMASVDRIRKLTKDIEYTSVVALSSETPPRNVVYEKQHEVKDSDLAYILYTSGSTGKPKGVAVEHRSLIASAEEHVKIYDLKPGSRLLQLAAWTFDVSVVDIFSTLIAGGTLCIGRKDFLLSDLTQAMKCMDITHVATTPTLLGMVSPDDVPSLQNLAIGGEPMTRHIRDIWTGRSNFRNVYGPTETTVNVVSCKLRKDSDIRKIGKPLNTVQAYILGDDLSQVFPGRTGQLAIGGVQVARGYLNLPPAQGNGFIRHPKLGKLFLTGDLAFFDEDGDIVCLGRRDNQIKLHGLRIELDEIESIAKSVPLVQDAAAMVVRGSGTSVLALVIKPTECKGAVRNRCLLGLMPNRSVMSQVMDSLVSRLPPHSMPSYWIPVETMPTNQNGKLARKELVGLIELLTVDEMKTYSTSTLQQDTKLPSTNNNMPKSPEELTLAKCWCQILGVSNVQLDANFFSLSGDSIAAIRMCGLVKQQGYSLRLRDIYRSPRLRELAAVMVKKSDKSTGKTIVDSGEIHLTPIMARFLSSDKFNVHWYNQSKLLKLRQGISAKSVSAALNAVLALHPAFRMRTIIDGERTTTMIEKPGSQAQVLNCSEATSLEEIAETYQDLQASLDITNGPVVATAMFSVEGEAYLAMVVHHLAIDVVSWRIVLGDLDQALQGEKLLPEETSLLSLPPQAFHSSDTTADGQHNVNPFLLADSDAIDGANIIGSTNRLTLQVHQDALPKLLEKIESSETQLVDFVVAGFLQALQAWRGADSVTLDFEGHGRNIADPNIDLTRTVGWFTEIIRVEFDVCEQKTLLERISAERRGWQGLDKTARSKSNPRGTTRSILFNYKGMHSDAQSYRNLEVVDMDPGSLEDPMNARDYVLEVDSEVCDGIIHLGIVFSKALHSVDDIKSVLQNWSLCISTLARPDGEAEVIGSVDRQQNPAFKRLSLTIDEEKELVECSLERHGIQEEDVTDIALATSVQTSMILSSMDNGAFFNDYCYTVRPRPSFDLERFKRAWTTVLDSFDMFRTVFVPCELTQRKLSGELFQVVLKPDSTQHDFSAKDLTMSKKPFSFGSRLSHLWIDQSEQGQIQLHWRCHHALSDGSSTRILHNLIHQAYQKAPLPKPTIQFVDISQDLIESYRSQETLDFWRDTLSGATMTTLVDHTLPLVDQKPVGRTFQIRANVQSQTLSDKAAQQGCTVSTLLRAAWALTISYYTSKDDIVFGIVSSGRTLDIDGIESVVGPCVNTVPFRMTIDWNGDANTHLQGVHGASMDLAEHDFLPLGQIYKASRTSDLFNTVLEYQGVQRRGSAASVPYEMLVVEMEEPSSFPLRVGVALEEGSNVGFQVRYHDHLFEEDFLRRFAGTFDLALQHICLASSTKTLLKEIDLLDPHHKRLMWSSIQGDMYPEDKNKTICEIFEDMAREDPEAIAIQFMTAEKTVNTTYQQLLDVSVRVAAVLHRAGVKHGDRVGLFMDKSAEMVACMLAAMRIGAAFVPIDDKVPLNRLEGLLEEASPAVLICSRKDRNRLCHVPTTILALEDLCLRRSIQSALYWSLPSTEDIAAILFTSGTTGKPKGVLIPHRQLTGYAVCCADSYGYSKTSRVFNFARYNFDVILTDVFSTLSVGGTVCISPQALVVGDFIPTLQRSKANAVNLTNSVAGLLRPEDVPCLTHMVITGEANSKAVIETWGDIVWLVNSYGPTEASVISSHHASAQSDPRCLGRSIPGMDVMLVDEKLRIVPLGTIGEIVVAGRQLSIGYLNRPEETNKGFVNNPFKLGTKMYMSGDLGFYDAKGRLHLLGRRDHQVKINGQRIELGEIENILSTAEIPVAVLYLKLATQKPKLILMFRTPRSQTSASRGGDCRILTDSASDPTAKKIIQTASQNLPAYMIPSRFIGISNIPLTPNGKVDRKALQKVFEDFLANGSTVAADELAQPETATEECLVKIIGKFLGVETLSVTDDLVATTLDSLSMMALAATIRQVTGYAASMQWIMRARSIRVMASKIDHAMESEAAAVLATKPNVVPASQTQQTSNVEDDESFIEPLTTLVPNPGKPRIYCVHGSSGLSNVFRRLSPFFSDIEMIGINNTLFGQADAFASVQDMAKNYLSHVTAHDNKGPYLIASYSFGDSVAIEMGRLLLAQGKAVYLILIDSSVERKKDYTIPDVSEGAELAFALGLLDRSQALSDDDRDFMHLLGVEWQRNVRNLNKFRMKHYAGPMTFIKAFETRQAEADGSETLTNGYDKYVPALNVVKMYGLHTRLFQDENYLNDLGACWRTAIHQGLQYIHSRDVLLE